MGYSRGKPVPMATRQVIMEWYERKRAIGTFKTIANKLGLPEGTVKRIAQAAMQRRAQQILRARRRQCVS